MRTCHSQTWTKEKKNGRRTAANRRQRCRYEGRRWANRSKNRFREATRGRKWGRNALIKWEREREREREGALKWPVVSRKRDGSGTVANLVKSSWAASQSGWQWPREKTRKAPRDGRWWTRQTIKRNNPKRQSLQTPFSPGAILLETHSQPSRTPSSNLSPS